MMKRCSVAALGVAATLVAFLCAVALVQAQTAAVRYGPLLHNTTVTKTEAGIPTALGQGNRVLVVVSECRNS